MHRWCPLYRDSTVASWKTCWVQPEILVLIINFFSLNFTSIEIEGERVSSTQNKHTLGRGVAVLKNEHEQTRGERRVKAQESWVNVLFECPHMEKMSLNVNILISKIMCTPMKVGICMQCTPIFEPCCQNLQGLFSNNFHTFLFSSERNIYT